MSYVATAIDKNKGYRVHVSKRFTTKKRAEKFARQYKKEYKNAIPKYRIFSRWKVKRI